MVLPEPDPPTLSEVDSAALLPVLDGITDPGNAGTIMRSAAAAGLEYVVLAGEGVDPYSSKTVRAGMGAHFRLHLIQAAWSQLRDALSRFDQGVGADAAAGTTIYQVDWSRRTALIIGSEAHGLSQEARELVTTLARVPMAEGVESLNAAVVASIILFHARKDALAPRMSSL